MNNISSILCQVMGGLTSLSLVIDHYYHFTAELLMGTWRSYCSLDPDISPTGETHLSPPRRIWFLHQDVREW